MRAEQPLNLSSAADAFTVDSVAKLIKEKKVALVSVRPKHRDRNRWANTTRGEMVRFLHNVNEYKLAQDPARARFPYRAAAPRDRLTDFARRTLSHRLDDGTCSS